MRAVGIIGYKNRGKTTLVRNLARELTGRGYIIGTIKHILQARHLDLSFKDTARHMQHANQTAAISPGESVLFFNHSKSIEEMMQYLEADFVLIEGFKEERTFPKIICFTDITELDNFSDGLQIGAVSLTSVSEKAYHGMPIFNIKENITEIADLIIKKTFKLPNLNCEACGYQTCYELAREILRGNKKVRDCPALEPETQVTLNGKVLPLNPFVSDIIRNTIVGMLSSLKGYHEGKKIQIKIE